MPSNYSCSEDSDISNPYVKSSFRVSVCLRQYFKDVRARCYILVSRNRRVRWLEKRIQKVFALHGAFCLCVNGHLLPSAEPLALLSPEDRVEVIPQLKEPIRTQDAMDVMVTNQTSEVDLQNNECLELPILSSTSCSMSYNVEVSEADNVCTEINHDENGSITNKIISRDDVDCVGASNSAVPSPSNTTLTDSTVDNIGVNNQEVTQEIQNGVDETLQQLKRRALELLDSQSNQDRKNDSESEVPRCKRRRVRRRTKRVAQTIPGVAESDSTQNTETLVEMSLPSTPAVIVGASSPIATAEPVLNVEAPLADDTDRLCSPKEKCTSPPQEVMRNEATSCRKPRIVRSIYMEN